MITTTIPRVVKGKGRAVKPAGVPERICSRLARQQRVFEANCWKTVMKNNEKYKPLKKSIQHEQKNVLTGCVAFAIAILILVIQGSIESVTVWSLFGLSMLAASIPIGIVGYLLSIKVLNTERVPIVGHQRTEGVAGLAITLNIVGFLFILWGFSRVLTIVLLISVVFSIWYFARAMHSWDAEIASWEEEAKVED